ncbi:hypothetical protein DPMN_093828 [Dreissena polymorpha]|uniref:Uncharacterized protein n=1 Tax=Dreissena polymorpha TaxID=45954 RepID=A0A9D4L403_DREPO|nr:hypothetical protein DPMN_093828 [Dreissena polymorpha]
MPHGRKRKQAETLEETLEKITDSFNPIKEVIIDFEETCFKNCSSQYTQRRGCGVSGQSVETLSLDLANNLGQSLNIGQSHELRRLAQKFNNSCHHYNEGHCAWSNCGFANTSSECGSPHPVIDCHLRPRPNGAGVVTRFRFRPRWRGNNRGTPNRF